jgi:Flp pilus assembly protein TadG
MIRIRQLRCDLNRDRTGGAAIEFALIAPTLLLLLFVVLDLGHMAYSSAILNGAVQEASRSAALETGSTAEADGFVRSSMQTIVPGATVTGSRTSYYDFSDVGRAERWNDANGNGACDNGEAYTDENRSGSWEADVGRNGNGGANDVVVYRVTVRYVPVFQIPFLPESWAARQMNAAAVRKNQPFSSQAGYGSAAGTCS